MIQVLQYVTAGGKNVFETWLRSLKDKRAAARVAARIERLQVGNFGDCKFLRDGIWEQRIDYGPGYRVYYSMIGVTIVLLLCGGDKRRQSADIAAAIEYLADYKKRSIKHETQTKRPPR